ncbi:MAG: hypothetical protein PHH98_04365 [Candidatus Gracilibacteria bacterium]|nr:hypothetical protein [Candidatus Gracilibacteria bacterium]
MFKFKKNLVKILIFTLSFSFLIFITKNYFFGGKDDFQNSLIEEKYIDPIVEINHSDNVVDNELLNKKVEEKLLQNLNSAIKIKYKYIPNDLFSEFAFSSYFLPIDTFLNTFYIQDKISSLDVVFNKEKGEVRGKMQDKKLKLFGIYNMSVGELLAVSIHEFGHFFDLYILEKKVTFDISDYFYFISWDGISTIKAGLEQKDFVSGYAMTNKYEDFAESFTYYILHNGDFLEKSNDSLVLKEKYDFFSKYVFRNDEFKSDNYKSTNEIKPYYRDITKIEFSLENFLQYLKK